MQIFFIRHAQDDDNYIGGWSSIDMTEEGKEQANILSNYFFENKKELKITRIISSDLKRALSTIAPTAQKLNLPIIQDASWRGLNNGKIGGLLSSEAKIKYPKTFLYDLDMDEHYPDGESPREFYERVKKAFHDILSGYDIKENIIVLTHGSNINVLYSILKGEEWDNKKKTKSILATSIVEVEFLNNRTKLKRTFFVD